MSEKWHGGKGSRYRKVDQKKYNENWERIFGNKGEKDESRKSVGDNGADRSERSSGVSQD